MTSKEVFIGDFKLSKEAFMQIVKASAGSERLVFCDSQIDLSSDIDFSGPDYKTSYLSFRYVGQHVVNNWKNNSECLKKVIKAISLCTLKDSLQKLDVIGWEIPIDKVEEMLKDANLGNIEIVEEKSWSIEE